MPLLVDKCSKQKFLVFAPKPPITGMYNHTTVYSGFRQKIGRNISGGDGHCTRQKVKNALVFTPAF